MTSRQPPFKLTAALTCALDDDGTEFDIAQQGGLERHSPSPWELALLCLLCRMSADEACEHIAKSTLPGWLDRFPDVDSVREFSSLLLEEGYAEVAPRSSKTEDRPTNTISEIPLDAYGEVVPDDLVTPIDPVVLRVEASGCVEAWSPARQTYVELLEEHVLIVAKLKQTKGDQRRTSTELGYAPDTVTKAASVFVAAGLASVSTRKSGRLRVPKHRASDPNLPIFVIGCPRSGTTLLRAILDRHPRIAAPPESAFLQHFKPFEWTETQTNLENLGVSRDATLAAIREFADRVIGTRARQYKKPRWADKSPQYWRSLDFIYDIWQGQCQFVRIVRHGLDVASSMSVAYDDRMAGFGEGIAEFGSTGYPLEKGCIVWSAINQELQRFAVRHDAAVHSIKYEDLVATPETTVRALMAFLGEEYDPTFLEKVFHNQDIGGMGDHNFLESDSVYKNSVRKWDRWPEPVIRSLASRLNPTLRLLDYEPLQQQP